MNNLIVFDKDGTLIKPLSGGPWVDYPEDQILIEGVKDRLKELRDAGWVMAIASNQGGVAAGHKSLDDAADEMFEAMKLTGIEWGMLAHSYEEREGEALLVSVDDSELITHSSLRFRKPAPGMLLYLQDLLYPQDYLDEPCAEGYPSTEGWYRLVFVGDRQEDQGAAEAAGFEFFWAADWLACDYPF